MGGLRGASAPLFLLVCMLWVRWKRDARYSAVRGTCGCRSQKVVARAAPPAAPCGGRGLGWRAPPPALLDSPASPPPTAGRACAPPCGGRRLALAAAAIIQWGGGAAAARPLWEVPLSPAGAVVPAGGGGRGAAVAAARGRAVPLRCTLGPGRRPRPRCVPFAPAGAGLGFRWLRPAGTTARESGRIQF